MQKLRKITLTELEKNDGENDNRLWVLIHGKIYDLTDFCHPGGKEILKDDHGDDRADEFDSIHSPEAQKDMKNYCIGELDQDEEKDEDSNNKKTNGEAFKTGSSSSSILKILPIIIISAAIVFYLKFYVSKSEEIGQ